MLEEVRASYGIGRPVRMAVTNSQGLLATFGVIRPTVLVPRDATRWSVDRVRTVLLHELAHVRRGDWLVQVFAESVRAIFWFNPLFWIGVLTAPAGKRVRVRRRGAGGRHEARSLRGAPGRDRSWKPLMHGCRGPQWCPWRVSRPLKGGLPPC